MRRCTALRPSNFRATGFGYEARRSISHDKAALTKEALLEKVEAGLGENVDGKPLRIDTESKTISTAVGDLPISPLFDPAWMKARRRQGKADPGVPLGRFRRKLANNPYARALATPMRRCPNTLTALPRYFLQDFEVVKHPMTGAAWWAPGPLAFEFIQPAKRPDGSTKTEGETGGKAGRDGPPVESASVAETDPATNSNDGQESRPRRAPLTSYTLCRKSIVDLLGGPSKKYTALLLALRHGMSLAPDTRNPVWREDMGDVLLRMMRRQAVDALIARAKDTLVQPCASWDAVKDVHLRGCVLWLPEKQAAVKQYATLDVEGVQYGRKMAVHNLFWLLGEKEVQRLRSQAEVFREGEILVLKQWSSVSMMRLHLLLWRLQGYLAEPQ